MIESIHIIEYYEFINLFYTTDQNINKEKKNDNKNSALIALFKVFAFKFNNYYICLKMQYSRN